MQDLQSLEKMIQAFKDVQTVDVQTEQTFMEITNYPHLENVYSNLLGFFFDTEGIHGFKDLFIRALLTCIGVENESYRTENVERETPTKKRDRIDIVIETEDYSIAIENKINGDVQNPLRDYEAYIKERARSNQKTAICILLTLKKEPDFKDDTSFRDITYSDFFNEIRRYLGKYVIDADSKWIIHLNDFIKTIEGLQEATVMDKEFVEFYNAYENDINKLVNATDDLGKSIKAKWNKIKQLIQIKSKGLKAQDGDFYKYNLSAEYWIEYDIKKIDEVIMFDIIIITKGCYIIVGIEDCTPDVKKKLERLLDKKKIKFSQCSEEPVLSGPDWSCEDSVLLEKFDIFESEETIAEKFSELQSIICN